MGQAPRSAAGTATAPDTDRTLPVRKAPRAQATTHPVPAAPKRSAPKARSWSFPWEQVLGCLALVLLLVIIPPLLLRGLAGLVDRGGSRSSGVRPGAGAPQRPGVGPSVMPADAGSQVGPINLPSPSGSAPRTRPLVTVLLPDERLDATARQALAEEADVWRDYVARYGMAEDRIVVASTAIPPTPRRATDPALRTEVAALATPSQPATGGRRVLLAEQVLQRFPDHDHLLVTVTPVAPPWTGLLPPWPAPAAPAPSPASGRRPPRRYGALVVRDGNTPGTGSGQKVIDATGRRGALAEALAETWVLATGGTWSGR